MMRHDDNKRQKHAVFFKLKTPTQSFRLKTTTWYLCYRILTTEKCCHMFGS